LSARASSGRGRVAPRLQLIDGGAREHTHRIEVLEEFAAARALACDSPAYRARLDALEPDAANDDEMDGRAAARRHSQGGHGIGDSAGE
jgi:hypothetical protein